MIYSRLVRLWLTSWIDRDYHSPNVHVLHTHYHVVMLVQEGTVEGDDIIGMAPMHNLELTHDSSSQFLFGFDVYDLGRVNIIVSIHEEEKSRL